jgi:hypothetical protein
MQEGLAFNVFVPVTGTAAFGHTTTDGNSTNNWTEITQADLTGNAEALVFAAHNHSVSNTQLNAALGVYYNFNDKWSVLTQNQSSMPPGHGFRVFWHAPSPNAFVHEATIANTIFHYTFLDHPLANGRPNAIILVTQNWNPGGGSGVYNDAVTGVFYNALNQRWAIYNEDLGTMPAGASFNVLVGDAAVHLPAVMR